MEKPTIFISSNSPQGNIYYILGAVSQALKKEHRISEFNDLRDQVLQSSSYQEAIAHIREHVELIDFDEQI